MTKEAVRFSRRRFLATGTAAAAGFAFGGCDRLSAAPTFREFLGGAEGLTQTVQRALLWRGALAREYSAADMSTVFRANGSQDAYNLPPAYIERAQQGFVDWRLQVDGLVMRPTRFTLADLRAARAYPDYPARLRRRLELHRRVDRAAAVDDPRSRDSPPGSSLHRVSLRRRASMVRGRYHTLLREHRPDRRVSSADDPCV